MHDMSSSITFYFCYVCCRAREEVQVHVADVDVQEEGVEQGAVVQEEGEREFDNVVQ